MPSAISLSLEPGQKATLQPVSWQRFEQILAELGESRSSRIAYFHGTLEIMSPLLEHERSKVLIGDLVKALLKIQKRSWKSLGSTTFKREGMSAEIEPDDCFYIENYKAVIGKDRLDLAVDPPPDLAIETDLTSKTELSAYEALRVPELWIYQAGKLTIYLFQQDRYVESQTSLSFSDVAIAHLIPQFIQRAKTVGVTQALEEFEQVISDGDR